MTIRLVFSVLPGSAFAPLQRTFTALPEWTVDEGELRTGVAEAAVAATSPGPLRTTPRAKMARNEPLRGWDPHLAFPLGDWQRKLKCAQSFVGYPNRRAPGLPGR